ncbi:MAG TPA: hypothetical protein VFR32_09665 [Gaiellaceae bacterium]|nr:hypothetical protein [Gaiellaceae bacterium]
MRYPVVWCEAAGPTYAGSLVLGPSSLTLDGSVGGARSVIELPYDELMRVRAGTRGERVRGRPTLLVEARGRTLRVATLSEAGLMAEVADELTRAMPVA